MSLKHIVCSDLFCCCWCSMCDKALDLGIKGTRLSQCLFSLFATQFLVTVSGHYEIKYSSHHNYFDHLNSVHLNNGCSEDVLTNTLEDDSQSLASLVSSLYQCQPSFQNLFTVLLSRLTCLFCNHIFAILKRQHLLTLNFGLENVSVSICVCGIKGWLCHCRNCG